MSTNATSELSSIDRLILKHKLGSDSSKIDENTKNKVIAQLSEESKRRTKLKPSGNGPVTIEMLDEEDHPERQIPDIPENKRVRDYLRSQPLTGHGAAFGKSINIVQCYRCKCYGHRAGDPECPYTETGDIQLELQKRIREDPVRCFKKIDSDKPVVSAKFVDYHRFKHRVERMKQLLEKAKKEEEKKSHRHHHKHKHRHHHGDHSLSRRHYSSSSDSSSSSRLL